MSTALYPGTFDPITFGHIDIAVVAQNPGKNPLFSVEERLSMVREALRDVPRIEVISYGGLVVNCVKEHKATVIIRGLRALTDFEYEFQMAYTNRKLFESAETVFLMPSARYTYLNSTMVKQIARFGGDIGNFVPEHVGLKLFEKFSSGGQEA